ncbi:class I SAM-dependent methyltransferase [Hymenobacter coalescens]
MYATKTPEQVSWTQSVPQTSLDFIHSFHLPRTARIIDVGGGDSRLVDFLLAEGYENLTVLDISPIALDKARQRLGSRAERVNWVISDITEFKPDITFDLWHDRAAFHFLTTEAQIARYLTTVRQAVTGFLTIGTFSEQGPAKCNGLPIRQYSEDSLNAELHHGFEKIRCLTEDHITPFATTQNFLFCSFRRQLIGE